MAIRKVSDYRIAQRQGAGYVLFKLINSNGTVTDWIGWQYIPPAQLASLHSILMTNNAYYDDVLRIFTTGGLLSVSESAMSEIMVLNPAGIKTLIKAKEKPRQNASDKKNKKLKTKRS